MAADARGALPALGQSRRLRFLTFFVLYVAQGVPEGLLYVAVPAWLAANGASAAAIGSYIGIILLPWSFKLANGFLMDRFAYLPMGRRRPWLLAAQGLMAAALIALAAAAPAPQSLALVTAFGFAVNLAASFQDVAIDGMAVDLLRAEERARANGLMWGGKTLGIAGSSFAAGGLMTQLGLPTAASATAAFVLAAMLLPLAARERFGEKRFPWSVGGPSPESVQMHTGAWGTILRGVFAAARARESLLLAAVIVCALAGYGLHTAMLPVVAVSEMGWSERRYTALIGWATLAGGLFGIVFAGPIAERVKPHRALLAALAVMAALHGGLAASDALRAFAPALTLYIVGYQLVFVQLSVAIYALAMRFCAPRVAATQFSLYMALINLGTAAGAAVFGPMLALGGASAALGAIATLSLAAAGIAAYLQPALTRAEEGGPLGEGEAASPRRA
jgi:PAT family beta-lactamase induction signal transducer AmpG